MPNDSAIPAPCMVRDGTIKTIFTIHPFEMLRQHAGLLIRDVWVRLPPEGPYGADSLTSKTSGF